MAGERVLEQGDAARLAQFLDQPRKQFGTRVTIAERERAGPRRRFPGRSRVALLVELASRRAGAV